MDPITISLVVVTCIILGIGFVVISDSREKLNRLYFVNIVSIIGWALAMIYYRMSSDDTIVIWSKLLYVSASLIASNFLYFTYVFPKYVEINNLKKLLIFLPNAILIYFILSGDHIITGAKVNTIGENFIYWGNLYIFYVVYILFYFNFAFLRLFKKINGTKDNLERSQLVYVLIGYGSSGVIAFTTNLILPSFGYFVLNWVGQISTILMAASAAYAIVRHGLFNAKLVAVEFLTFCLWIILLTRTLLVNTLNELIINSLTLVLTFFFGIFLIRSIKKEITQREKIEKLATDLESANVRLTDLDRQKSEFVSFATHQLRAPLTAMKGYASMILEGDMGQISESARVGVSRIFDSSKTLANIVDDYLNITRIELGTMKYAFDTIDFKALVDDVIAELGPNLKRQGLDFTFKAEDIGDQWDWRITADRDKLKQVIANIIDNSIKYTPKGYVKVSLSFNRPHHKFIFKTEDNGIGIAPETLPLLFNKFSRAGNANKTNIKGTGLGLFVAKQIIEAHHGTITAMSPGEGKGSTFTVELDPFSKA